MLSSSPYPIRKILLADDDPDDCFLFKELLEELSLSAQLTIVYDGEQLMHLLTDSNNNIPDILFLDLNMPRKNGFACLAEIKQNEKLKKLPVIILSTSFEKKYITQVYESGAHYYIRKPNDCSQFRNLISKALQLSCQTNETVRSEDQFILQLTELYNEEG